MSALEDLAGAPVSLVALLAKMLRGAAALMDGDLARVERALVEIEPFLGSDRNILSAYLAQLFELRYEQGRICELWPFLSGAIEANPGLRALRVALAFTAAQMGDARQAQRLLASERGHGFIHFPRNIAWMTSMSLAAEVAAYLGDAAWSEELYDLMLPSQGTFVVVAWGVACRGAVDRFLGILEVTRGRLDTAVRHLVMAEEMEVRLRAQALVARTRYWQARALLLRAASGDIERAEAALEHARRTARQLGLSGLARDIANPGQPVSA